MRQKYYKKVYIKCRTCSGQGRRKTDLEDDEGNIIGWEMRSCEPCKDEGFTKTYITIREYMKCGEPEYVYKGQQPPG